MINGRYGLNLLLLFLHFGPAVQVSQLLPVVKKIPCFYSCPSKKLSESKKVKTKILSSFTSQNQREYLTKTSDKHKSTKKLIKTQVTKLLQHAIPPGATQF